MLQITLKIAIIVKQTSNFTRGSMRYVIVLHRRLCIINKPNHLKSVKYLYALPLLFSQNENIKFRKANKDGIFSDLVKQICTQTLKGDNVLSNAINSNSL